MEDFLRSCHNTVKDHDAKKLAAKMGLAHVSLLKRANPDDDGNHLTIEHLYGVLLHTSDMRPLHALASEFGYRLDKAPENAGGDMREQLLNVSVQVADVVTAAAHVIESHRFTASDQRKLNKEIDEAVEALLSLKSASRAV